MLVGLNLIKIKIDNIIVDISDMVGNVIIIETFHQGDTISVIEFLVVAVIKIVVVKIFLGGFCIRIIYKIIGVNFFET